MRSVQPEVTECEISGRRERVRHPGDLVVEPNLFDKRVARVSLGGQQFWAPELRRSKLWYKTKSLDELRKP